MRMHIHMDRICSLAATASLALALALALEALALDLALALAMLSAVPLQGDSPGTFCS